MHGWFRIYWFDTFMFFIDIIWHYAVCILFRYQLSNLLRWYQSAERSGEMPLKMKLVNKNLMIVIRSLQIAHLVNFHCYLRNHPFLKQYIYNYKTHCSRGGEWSFKISGSHKILVEFRESHSLVFFLAVTGTCVLQSQFLYKAV